MAILRYESLSHTELASLNRDRTVVFLPTGPIEQHGPHLPFGTDAFTAEFFAEKIASRLGEKREDWNFLLLPPVFAGCDTLTYTGTIEVRPNILRAFLYDSCKQLARDGFRTIIALTGHGGPRHSIVLEELAAKMKWRHRTRMINASGRILQDILEGSFVDKISERLEKSGAPLTDAERAGLKQDYHGGLLETSIMLVVKPNMVKPVYKELKPALVKSFWKLKRTSGKTVGDGLGHLGSPALARREIGEAAVEVLLDDVMPLVERFVSGEDVTKKFRSRFYYFPFLRTDFRPLAIFAMACLGMIVMLWFLNMYLVEMFR